ncbi:hypothetical protein BRADI_2g14411v3 [Brachypodium distachyon]|uniref:Uncharacterized protein n=1 Tax=Brachypodium distachyon TaxID=15368 RepID=A0A2K2D8L2_BRADI|nr:hypothetical protein BRADI_2g14411v3 [Brachypodium distachyon]
MNRSYSTRFYYEPGCSKGYKNRTSIHTCCPILYRKKSLQYWKGKKEKRCFRFSTFYSSARHLNNSIRNRQTTKELACHG